MEQRGPPSPPRHCRALREPPPQPRPRPSPQRGPRRSPFSRRRRLTPPPWPGAADPAAPPDPALPPPLTDTAAPQPSWGHMTPRPLTPPPGSGGAASPSPYYGCCFQPSPSRGVTKPGRARRRGEISNRAGAAGGKLLRGAAGHLGSCSSVPPRWRFTAGRNGAGKRAASHHSLRQSERGSEGGG